MIEENCSPKGRRNIQFYLLKARHRVKQFDVQSGIVLREGTISVVLDELDDRNKIVRLRKAILAIAVANFYELVGATFAQCQRVLATLRRRVSHEKSPIWRVDHFLVHLVPGNIAPVPFRFLEGSWPGKSSDNC